MSLKEFGGILLLLATDVATAAGVAALLFQLDRAANHSLSKLLLEAVVGVPLWTLLSARLVFRNGCRVFSSRIHRLSRTRVALFALIGLQFGIIHYATLAHHGMTELALTLVAISLYPLFCQLDSDLCLNLPPQEE